jgi:hypothetical protein
MVKDLAIREAFYEYTSQIRKEMNYYLNMAKLKKFWRSH